ncbi:MAG: AraC family transcriptional regulator [Acidobacteria bacterium]|nr:AraC family transcriptional regulator [Acidobacteriota bacterium]
MKSIGWWDAGVNQTWGLPWHRNEGLEITFLESGKLSFATDEREYSLQPDTLTITRPWQKHRVGSPLVSASKLHWLILDMGVRRPNQSWHWPSWIMLSPPDLADLAGILRGTDKPVWKASGELRHCILAIGAALKGQKKASRISALTIRINELLLVLLNLLRRQSPGLDETLTSSRRTVQMLLDDLAQHPQHLSLEWTVPEMATSCGLGITQFVHIVKQLTNMTPVNYLRHCRLKFAAKLLRDQPKESITEIAQTCGFSSSQYFATVFRRSFGCSPGDFKAGKP